MEVENTLLRIIEEYGEIDEIDLGNLLYILKFIGYPIFDDFKMGYLGFDSYELRKTIKKLANKGQIKIKNSNFETYYHNGKSHKNNDAISDIIRILKNVSLYRFALYCRIVEFNPRSGVLNLAKRYGIPEEESKNYENLIKTFTYANQEEQNLKPFLQPVLSSP